MWGPTTITRHARAAAGTTGKVPYAQCALHSTPAQIVISALRRITGRHWGPQNSIV